MGSITLCTTLISILVNLSAVGFSDSIVNKRYIKNVHINVIFTLILSLSTLLYIISVLLVYFLKDLGLSPLVVKIYPILALRLLLDSITFVPLAILSRRMDFKRIAIRTIFCSCLSVLAAVPALAYGAGFIAIILSQLATSFASFSVLWYSANYRPKILFSRRIIAPFFNFGINNSLTRLVNSLNLDNILLGALGSLYTLGIYSFGKRILSVFTDIISSAISNVSFPVYSSLNNNNMESLREVYLRTVFISVLISMPVFTGLILISKTLIPTVFGAHWISAVPTVNFFFVFGFLSCIGSLQLSLIKAKGNTAWIFRYQMFQQLTTACITAVFAKQGAEVVIMLIVIKTYITWPYTIFYISKLLDVSVWKYFLILLKPLLPLSIMVLGFFIFSKLSSFTSSLLYVFFQSIVCAITYSFCSYLFFKRDVLLLVKAFKR